jgi:2-dehydro-3-deoxyphosphogluconate aldolase/(4S)-4-hydroxy-2-oxoglutarate aldolase
MDPLLKWFEENKFIAVIRSASSEDAESMIKAAIDGGFRIFEISVQTSQAFRILENYSKKEGLLFGAGAVTDGEIAQRAINAGAKFLSSHYTDHDVISVAKNNDVFVIQGASTPTEAVNAFHFGADLINIYPVTSFGGADYVKFLRGPLPFLKLVASGDIRLENAFDYFKYCVAIYMDRAVFDKSLIRANNWTEIKARCKQLTQKLEALKVSK